jgi:hypothetical protein
MAPLSDTITVRKMNACARRRKNHAPGAVLLPGSVDSFRALRLRIDRMNIRLIIRKLFIKG